MRSSKKITAFILIFTILFTFPSYSTEVKSLEWNGKTELKNNTTYTISRNLRIRDDFILPKNSVLYIKDGAVMTINSEITVNIRGTLFIEQGGVLEHKRGNITVRPSAKFDISGDYLQYTDTSINMQTPNFMINETGFVKSSGNFNQYKDAKLQNSGYIMFTPSSTVITSDEVTINENAEMYIQGKYTISVSGSLVNYGHLAIGKNGNIKNSGGFVIENGSSFTNVGKLAETKSGGFIDYRETFKYEDMTVSILADQPTKKYKGIDVSWANGKIDWAKVKNDGINFAIIRAGRGSVRGYSMAVDERFAENMQGAAKNKIHVGVYFYSYATTVSQARKEAEFFVKTIEPYMITYPVILDMEDDVQKDLGKNTLTKMVEVFFEVLMENGYYPMIYSYKSWFENHLDMVALDKYAVWLAHWDVEKTNYQNGFYIWQYSATGRVDGIVGDVDLNISYRNFPIILRDHNLNHL